MTEHLTDSLDDPLTRWKYYARKHESKNRRLYRALDQARVQLDELEADRDRLVVQNRYQAQLLRTLQPTERTTDA